MSRLALPMEIAELTGAARHNPQRFRDNPPKSTMPLGQAPQVMSEAARRIWFEFEAYAPAGVMTGNDRPAMEMLCELFAEFRENPRTFAAAKYARATILLAHFGMTPSSRRGVAGPAKKKDDSPFGGF
jgi:phage terminase small subunit